MENAIEKALSSDRTAAAAFTISGATSTTSATWTNNYSARVEVMVRAALEFALTRAKEESDAVVRKLLDKIDDLTLQVKSLQATNKNLEEQTAASGGATLRPWRELFAVNNKKPREEVAIPLNATKITSLSMGSLSQTVLLTRTSGKSMTATRLRLSF